MPKKAIQPKKQTNTVSALYKEMKIAYKKGQYDLAADYCNKILELKPDDSKAMAYKFYYIPRKKLYSE